MTDDTNDTTYNVRTRADLLDENGEGDARATAEAARVRERRREMSPGERKALWHAQKREHNRRIAEKDRKMRETYPSIPYDESPLSKSDDVPDVDLKQSTDWLAESRDDDEADG